MTTTTLAKPHFESFTIERSFAHKPERVFRAFEDPQAHYRWFVSGEGWEILNYTHDFKVGGHEHGRFRPVGAPFMLSNDTWYLEIVAGRKIVNAYSMAMDGNLMSHSLTVTELFPDGPKGCRAVFTEQGMYYGGPNDVTNRREGFAGLLDKLAEELATH